jgi:hypothetical protein
MAAKRARVMTRTVQPPPWLPAAPAREELVVTTFRITPAMHQYLKDAAKALSGQKGYGRADASEALRHLLQAVMMGDVEFKQSRRGRQG